MYMALVNGWNGSSIGDIKLSLMEVDNLSDLYLLLFLSIIVQYKLNLHT